MFSEQELAYLQAHPLPGLPPWTMMDNPLLLS